MIIDLKKIDLYQRQDFAYELTCEELGLEDVKIGSSIRVEGFVIMIEDSAVSVNLDVDYIFSDLCARCLVPVEKEMYVEIRELFEKSCDAEYIMPADELLELNELVAERVVMSLPPRLLCSKECKGLCHSCGTNLNVSQCSCEIIDESESDNPFAILRDKITKGGATYGSTKKKNK